MSEPESEAVEGDWKPGPLVMPMTAPRDYLVRGAETVEPDEEAL